MKKFLLVVAVGLTIGSLELSAMMGEGAVWDELYGKMAKLEETKDPHALDGEMPILANRLAEAFHHRSPDVHLLDYEDARDLLLNQAGQLGAAPVYNAGVQKAGDTYAAMLQRRFNAIPAGPLLEATKTLLPITYFLNQQSDSLNALIWSSAPTEGTTDSAYYTNLLRDSIAFMQPLPVPPEPARAAPAVVEPVAVSVVEDPEAAELAWALAESLRLQEAGVPPVSSPAPQTHPIPPPTALQALKPPPPHLPPAASRGSGVDSELVEKLVARRAKIEEAINPG